MDAKSADGEETQKYVKFFTIRFIKYTIFENHLVKGKPQEAAATVF